MEESVFAYCKVDFAIFKALRRFSVRSRGVSGKLVPFLDTAFIMSSNFFFYVEVSFFFFYFIVLHPISYRLSL